MGERIKVSVSLPADARGLRAVVAYETGPRRGETTEFRPRHVRKFKTPLWQLLAEANPAYEGVLQVLADYRALGEFMAYQGNAFSKANSEIVFYMKRLREIGRRLLTGKFPTSEELSFVDKTINQLMVEKSQVVHNRPPGMSLSEANTASYDMVRKQQSLLFFLGNPRWYTADKTSSPTSVSYSLQRAVREADAEARAKGQYLRMEPSVSPFGLRATEVGKVFRGHRVLKVEFEWSLKDDKGRSLYQVVEVGDFLPTNFFFSPGPNNPFWTISEGKTKAKFPFKIRIIPRTGLFQVIQLPHTVKVPGAFNKVVNYLAPDIADLKLQRQTSTTISGGQNRSLELEGFPILALAFKSLKDALVDLNTGHRECPYCGNSMPIHRSHCGAGKCQKKWRYETDWHYWAAKQNRAVTVRDY